MLSIEMLPTHLLRGITPPNTSARRYSKRYCSCNGHFVHCTELRRQEIQYDVQGRQLSRPNCTTQIEDKSLCLQQNPIRKYLEGKTRRSNPISPELMRWLNERDQVLGIGKP
jgi:SET domain-containing protein